MEKEQKEILYGKIFVVVIVLLFIGLVWRNCSVSQDRDFYRDKVTKGESELKVERDKHGVLSAKMDATLTSVYELKNSQDSTIKQLRSEVKNINKLVSSIRFSGSTGGTFSGDVINNTTVINGDTVVEQRMEYKDDWFSFKGSLINNKYKVEPKFKEQYAVNTYWEKPGFFKEPDLKVEIKSQNPYSDITAMQPIIVPSRRKKWYETRGFVFGAGMLGMATLDIALSK